MESVGGAEEGRQFSGLCTWMLIRHLRANATHDEIDQLLHDAGETRTADELFDIATWSSYWQFRRLIEVTAARFGPDTLREAASAGLADPTMPEMANMLQALGSPDALLEVVSESGGATMAPVLNFSGRAIAPSEWIVAEQFVDGFEHFPAYCHWATGLYENIPKLFGMRPEVEHIACACSGAPVCEYRIRWFPDEPGAGTDFLESRIDVLTAQLESLHQTVSDLVSEDDLERVLTKIVTSAAHAMHAPIFVLALEALPSAPKNVYATGIDDAQANRLAADLLTAAALDDEHRIDVEVLSSRRSYGRLAAINPGGSFFPQERIVLTAYAAPGRRGARLGRGARRSPPPGPHRSRPARTVELARSARHHRRHGGDHRRRAPGRHRL